MAHRSAAVFGLHPAENAYRRATLTTDSRGLIITANAAVHGVFGVTPEELVDRSVKELIQLMPQAASDELGQHADLMRDMASFRVVNGKHRDGSLVPLLVTSTSINIAQHQLYALLFEQPQGNSAILTLDGAGIIQGATENVASLLAVHAARHLCGLPLASLCLEPHVDPVRLALCGSSAQPGGASVDLLMHGRDGHALICVAHVIEVLNGLSLVAVREKRASSLALLHKPAKELGYYTVQRKGLGSGQSGLVLQGLHRPTGVPVAIKTLKRDVLESVGVRWPGRERFLMQHLNHPNVVKLYDFLPEDPDTHHLIMEYMPGGHLLHYCTTHRDVPEATARGFYRDLVSALDYIHSKGIVHRDVKLENCLLDEAQQHVKLSDFGLGTSYLNAPLCTSCGSRDYAAPELFTTTMYHGPPVDVWASGVVLFGMVTGVFPFDNVQATLSCLYAFPATRTWSSSLKTLVHEIFQVNPDLRATLDQVRRHEWVNAGHSKPPLRLALDKTPGVHSAVLAQQLVEVRCDAAQPFRDDILALMESEFGFTAEAVIESLLQQDLNQFTATYKMLECKYVQPVVMAADKLEQARQAVAFVQRRRLLEGLDLEGVRHSVRQRRASVVSSNEELPQLQQHEPQAMLEDPLLPGPSSSEQAVRLARGRVTVPEVVSGPAGGRGCDMPDGWGRRGSLPAFGAMEAAQPTVMGGVLKAVWELERLRLSAQASDVVVSSSASNNHDDTSYDESCSSSSNSSSSNNSSINNIDKVNDEERHDF